MIHTYTTPILCEGMAHSPVQSGPPYDARTVANFLLDIADSRGVPLTQVAVLKLLYFAHGWYLAYLNQPLILQDFEAWQFGPVVKVVRDEFAKWGRAPINSRATVLNVLTGERYLATSQLGLHDAAFVQRIFEAYHIYDAWQLSGLTHEANSPWDRIWNSLSPFGRMALRITNEEIRAHFIKLPKRFAVS
jgi:uncharacterized phage-associated protein